MREYYSVRRLNPYMGVIQVIDVGFARAYSTDGEHWRIRSLSEEERERAGDDHLLTAPSEGSAELQQALRWRPPLPFPSGDRYELWLLHRDTGMPLALLRSERWLHNTRVECAPTWRPLFAADRGLSSGGEDLERLIDFASRPKPAAQWFERQPEGERSGLGGLRVPENLLGRTLPAAAFPELLCEERWSEPGERAQVEAFHEWNAARLLAHQDLSATTRARLERAAFQRPETLLEHFRMFPQVLDHEAMQVALVAARLVHSARGLRRREA